MTTNAMSAPDERLLSAPGARGLGSWYPSRGVLWAKLQGLESTVRILQVQASPEERPMLDQLLYRLELAKSCLEGPNKRPRVRMDDAQFWGLVHGVAADLLLLMPPGMLATQALEVDEQFRRNVQEPISRQTWLGLDGSSGPLPLAVKQVLRAASETAGDGADAGRGLMLARNVLRGALRMVNEQSDQRFRQLAFALLVRSLSGALLTLLFIAAFLFNIDAWLPPAPEARSVFALELPLPLVSLILLGAGGAIVANMTSEPPVLAARGPVWRQFVYYLFVRPAIGAFAAFLFYLLARSGMLFGIESATEQTTMEQPPAIRIVLGSTLAVQYAYAIISIAVGFSADRVLGSTMDKVLGRLFSMADKSVQSPDLPASMPPPAEQPPRRAFSPASPVPPARGDTEQPGR